MNQDKKIEKAKARAISKLRESHRNEPDADTIANEIIAGNRSALSKGLTWVESNHPDIHDKGKKLVNLLQPNTKKSIRIGITGVPGVGKSTFIEHFGLHLIEQGKKIAVLAIDPSSQKTHGSILGDKTRMEKLSSNQNAFIRPTPSADSLGGVARSTRESIALCEAAGYDIIIIETVGVGQSEVAVHSMTDFFLLLMLAGAGDELQGIKRGIMEMADAIVITKADGDNVQKANQAMVAFKNALHLFPESEDGWIPRVTTCSALQSIGIEKVWNIVDEHHRHLLAKNKLTTKRANQAVFWFNSTLNDLWTKRMLQTTGAIELKQSLETAITNGTKSPFDAADEFMEFLQKC